MSVLKTLLNYLKSRKWSFKWKKMKTKQRLERITYTKIPVESVLLVSSEREIVEYESVSFVLARVKYLYAPIKPKQEIGQVPTESKTRTNSYFFIKSSKIEIGFVQFSWGIGLVPFPDIAGINKTRQLNITSEVQYFNAVFYTRFK